VLILATPLEVVVVLSTVDRSPRRSFRAAHDIYVLVGVSSVS
jgi:hypothetical protein